MQHLLDALASGIHDAKNQLFIAESVIAASEAKHDIDLGEARYAIEAAANRLSRTLAAYRLSRHSAQLAILPSIVDDLCAEVGLAQKKHLAHAGIALDIDCQVRDEWPLDRDMVTDMLNNAVQNAGRFAQHQIVLRAAMAEGGLVFRIDDDGPGFAELPPRMGSGLLIAERLAELHSRQGQTGRLCLGNDSPLGGARFELWLP